MALEEARNLTDEAKSRATSHDCATVYLAYNDQGKYLGGDTWVDE